MKVVPSRLAVMQPYFLPYVGHFSLFKASSHWVVFDLPRFAKKTFVSRNWMATPSGNASRLGGEIYCPTGGIIAEATFVSHDSIREKLLGNLKRWSKLSPHGVELCDFIEDALLRVGGLSVARTNAHLFTAVAGYLGVSREVTFASDLEISENEFGGPGGWAPTITKALEERVYMNPMGGKTFLNPCSFKTFGAQLVFHQYNGPVATVNVNGEVRAASIVQQILEFGRSNVSDQIDQFSLENTYCGDENRKLNPPVIYI